MEVQVSKVSDVLSYKPWDYILIHSETPQTPNNKGHICLYLPENMKFTITRSCYGIPSTK